MPPRRATALPDAIAVFALALLVRLVQIDRPSLWIDEFFSIFWSRLDLAFLLGQGARIETNPPAYYVLLHGWMLLVGQSPLALRALGAAASAGSVVTAYATMRLLAGRPAARLAAALLACNATSVFFAQQVRAYPFVALADGLMLLALAGYCRRLEQARPRLGCVALFVSAAIASVLLHYTSLLTVAAGFGAIALYFAAHRPLPRREALVWLAAALVTATAVLQPALAAHALAASPNIAWIDELSPWLVRSFVQQLLTHPDVALDAPPVLAFAALLTLVLLASLARLRPDRAQACVLLAMPALFGALLFGVSLAHPILLPRVAQWLELPLCMLLAAGILAWPARPARIALASLAAAALLPPLLHLQFLYATQDWRRAARIVAANPQCSGPIVTTGSYGLGILYYQPQTASRTFYDVNTLDGEQATSEHLLGQMVDHAPDLDGPALRQLIATHPHVALIILPQQIAALQDDAPDVLAAARWQAKLPGNLDLRCY